MRRRQPHDDYQPFRNVEARNFLQTAIEVPLLVHGGAGGSAHPPWSAAPRLERTVRAVLWSCQVKRGAGIA